MDEQISCACSLEASGFHSRRFELFVTETFLCQSYVLFHRHITPLMTAALILGPLRKYFLLTDVRFNPAIFQPMPPNIHAL